MSELTSYCDNMFLFRLITLRSLVGVQLPLIVEPSAVLVGDFVFLKFKPVCEGPP